MGWDASEHMSAISGHQPMSVGFVERVTSGLRHCFVPDVLHGIYPRCFYSHSTVEAIHSVICSDIHWCLNYVSGQSCVNNRIFIIVLAEKQKEVLKTEQQIYPFGCRWLWAGGGKFVQWVDHNGNPATIPVRHSLTLHKQFISRRTLPFPSGFVKSKRLTIDSEWVIILICNGCCLNNSKYSWGRCTNLHKA